tara:strand:+ start:1529 stop:1945 length:417 start_codon:yes stop_codon:yes gene_type:complete
MSANIYEYGIDPKNGLSRRLVRDAVVVQEETDINSTPSVVIHLRLQTYVTNNDLITVVTDETAGYKVTKGSISYNVDGEPLPKNIINTDGTIDTPINEETNKPFDRNNGYDNVIKLASLNIPFDSVLDSGIKEYYKLV